MDDDGANIEIFDDMKIYLENKQSLADATREANLVKIQKIPCSFYVKTSGGQITK